MPPAQRAEIALHTVTLPCRLGQVEVARVFQVRTLVEVTLEAPRKEAHVVLLQFRLIPFFDEPVLLVDDGEIRQDLDRLAPAAVYRLIFRACHGI